MEITLSDVQARCWNCPENKGIITGALSVRTWTQRGCSDVILGSDELINACAAHHEQHNDGIAPHGRFHLSKGVQYIGIIEASSSATYSVIEAPDPWIIEALGLSVQREREY